MSKSDLLLSRLDKVSGKHPKWMARCPAHSDNGPSLSIKELDDGRILVHCFAGCGASDIMTAIGLSLSDLYPERRGEFAPAGSHRSSENRPRKPAFDAMQDEIYRLRALAGVK